MLRPRMAVATLVAALGLALAAEARAESLAQCTAPIFFLAPQAIGVDLPSGVLAHARLSRAGPSGFEDIPVNFASSQETSCYSLDEGSVRVVPSVPLVPGSSYVLEVGVAGEDCASGSSSYAYRFIARSHVELPSELPLPTAELLVRRCQASPDYYFFRLARPLVPGAEGLEFRLSVNGELHYCHNAGIRGVSCKNGDSERFRLQWIAELPHTGVRVAGPVNDVELLCSQARQIPCSENPDASAAQPGPTGDDLVRPDESVDAGSPAAEEVTEPHACAEAPAAANCQLSPGPTRGCRWFLLCLACLSVLASRSPRGLLAYRQQQHPKQLKANAQTSARAAAAPTR